jgi:hypothetical protein
MLHRTFENLPQGKQARAFQQIDFFGKSVRPIPPAPVSKTGLYRSVAASVQDAHIYDCYP